MKNELQYVYITSEVLSRKQVKKEFEQTKPLKSQVTFWDNVINLVKIYLQ